MWLCCLQAQPLTLTCRLPISMAARAPTVSSISTFNIGAAMAVPGTGNTCNQRRSAKQLREPVFTQVWAVCAHVQSTLYISGPALIAWLSQMMPGCMCAHVCMRHGHAAWDCRRVAEVKQFCTGPLKAAEGSQLEGCSMGCAMPFACWNQGQLLCKIHPSRCEQL